MVTDTTADAKPHLLLRAATASGHEQVDAAFARYDLALKADYVAFLIGHARVLPPIEAALRDYPGLPPFRPRTPALAADLSALGAEMPERDDVASPASTADAWGMMYVVEGSRLGGGFLARRVSPAFPKAYLEAVHERGGWRAMLDSFDAAADAGGPDWIARAIETARATFDRYHESANR